MFEVLDTLKIGSNLSVTLSGKCDDVKNGSMLIDEKGNVYNVISVAMTRYDNPADIAESTTLLVMPCTLKKGEKLKKLK